MKVSIRPIVAFVALAALSAQAADVSATLDYTGKLVSDNEIRLKREGTESPVVEFVATRVGGR